jgi:hypothetical protein
MKDYFVCDRVLRDLFEMDHPSLLEQWTGGVHIREFLNVAFPRMMERRADLVALLEDDSVFHFEFQGQNDKQMGYREGIYCLLISQKYQRPVRQVVLYVGKPKMRMKSELDAGGTKVSFRLIDIREIEAETLLRSGCPGDLALAMLAKGGTERLAEIARRAAALSDRERVRVLTQLVLLSGLRGLSGKLKMELTTMGSLRIEIQKNEILRDIWEEVMAEGEAVGMVKILRVQLLTKFGRVPKWAEDRLQKANKAQIERWSKKFVTAQSLEGVIGKQ